jgi:hypothetical protein
MLRANWPDNHEVIEAWSFKPMCDHIPFAFIFPVYEYRRKLKASGHHGATVLKLGLNSLYGKLAQQVGWQHDRRDGTKSPPSFHCLEWAGWITSYTRARVLSIALADPDSVIAFETDGLYSTVQHVPSGDGSLGSWEVTPYDGLTYVQSGVYWTRTGDVWAPKYRGMDPPIASDPDAFTRERVLQGWDHGELSLSVNQTRFRGMMTSTISPERFCEWRQWTTESRDILLAPRGKRVHSRHDCPLCLAGNPSCKAALHHTMATGGGSMSSPHPLAWITPGVKTLEGDEYYRAQQWADEEDEDG